MHCCCYVAENNYDEVAQYCQPDVVMVNTVCPVDPQPDSGVSTLKGVKEASQGPHLLVRNSIITAAESRCPTAAEHEQSSSHGWRALGPRPLSGNLL
jgi:hypothetical protein